MVEVYPLDGDVVRQYETVVDFGIDDSVFSALSQVAIKVEDDGGSRVLGQEGIRCPVTQVLPGQGRVIGCIHYDDGIALVGGGDDKVLPITKFFNGVPESRQQIGGHPSKLDSRELFSNLCTVVVLDSCAGGRQARGVSQQMAVPESIKICFKFLYGESSGVRGWYESQA